MAAEAHMKRPTVTDPAQQLSKQFADVFQSYLECSDEVQAAIIEMVKIVKAPDATDEERESALETMAEALFPAKHNNNIGIDFDDGYESEAPVEVKRVLMQMEKEEAGFSERVSVLLEKRNMTQRDLAAGVGIGQPAISMILSRNCRPQKRTVEKIAKVLMVSPEELWPGFKDD